MDYMNISSNFLKSRWPSRTFRHGNGHKNGNRAFSAIMAEFPEPMVSDVLADCVLASSDSLDSNFDCEIERKAFDMDGLEPRETGPTRVLKESDFMRVEVSESGIFPELETESIFIFAEDGDTDFMWPQPCEELIEVEVISSMPEDETESGPLTDLDNGYVSSSPRTENVTESSQASASGDVSEPGSDTSPTMDLSLKRPRVGEVSRNNSSFSDTHHSTNFVRAHSHHSQTGALDLSLSNGIRQLSDFNSFMNVYGMNDLKVAQYMHYSGGVAKDMTCANATTPQESASSLIDLSTSGKVYQIPKLKIESYGVVPVEQPLGYKMETDCNHNEAYKPDINEHNETIPSEDISTFHPSIVKSESSIYDDPPLLVAQDELSNISCAASEYDSNTDSYSGTNSKADDFSSQCRIPLTVTSADDDNDSGTESVDSKNSEKSVEKGCKKRPGRKKGQVSKVYHLWEFIRDVLADPNKNPTVIKWENEEEGIFRVVQSEVAAAMWGNKKNNRTKMTYEKMSRSIRYSRKEGYFADIPRDKGYPKKLCFKFGQKAHGWRQAVNKTK